MRKLLSITLALAIMFTLIASIAFAHHARDGTAPVLAQHFIMMTIPGLAIHISPAITISPQPPEGIVTATNTQTTFRSEVTLILLCHSSDLANSPNIVGNSYEGQVTAPARMASIAFA
jgi:hypothetical protein